MIELLVAGCGFAALVFAGMQLRKGKTGVVRRYVIATVALLIFYAFNLGALAGPEFAHLPGVLLLVLVPGVLALAIWAVKRDRDVVMGRTADRDAMTTAAVVYGAGMHQEAGGSDANGGMEV